MICSRYLSLFLEQSVIQPQKVKVIQNGKVVSYDVSNKVIGSDATENVDINGLNIANDRLKTPPLIDNQGDKVTPIKPKVVNPVLVHTNPTHLASQVSPLYLPANGINSDVLINDASSVKVQPGSAAIHGIHSGTNGKVYLAGDGRLRVNPSLHDASGGIGHVISNGNVVDGDVLSDDVSLLTTNLASTAHRIVNEVGTPVLADSVANNNVHLVGSTGNHIAQDAGNKIAAINEGQ